MTQITPAPPYLVDIHGVMVRRLRADTGLTALVDQRIFARHYPEKVTLPALRITFPAASGATVPVPTWWAYTGQIEVHADNHQQAYEVSQELQRALLELEGSDDPDVVIAAIDPFGVQTGFDSEWTPKKPLWIVAVNVTARAR